MSPGAKTEYDEWWPPIFLYGGYRYGNKMNNIYSLEYDIDADEFTWNLLKVPPGKPEPSPRSGFEAGSYYSEFSGEPMIIIYGGSGEDG